MTPGDKGMLDTVNLLVLLFRARKHAPEFDEKQQHTLTVTKEHLASAGLTIPVFSNTLNILADKGYLTGVVVFEDSYHAKIRDAVTEKNFNALLERFDSTEAEVLAQRLQEAAVVNVAKVAPPNLPMSREMQEALAQESRTLREMLNDSREMLVRHSDQDIAIAVLLPFRSIDRLLEKMNSGLSFEEVQDTGIWYDAQRYEFHFEDEVMSTANRGTATLVHPILNALFNTGIDYVAEYSDLPDFDDNDRAKENKRYADAVRHFITKYASLAEVFKVYSDRVELLEPYRSEIH